MGDIQEEIKRQAGGNFRDGYNCAEAILRAFNQQLSLGLPDEALKMASGFGGGLGHSGCVCGALAASVMVLGALEGRTSNTQSRNKVYQVSEGFHQKFNEAFGGTCCRVLNPHPFETKEHLRNCLKITGRTAEVLMSYIEENRIGGDRGCQGADAAG